MLVLPSPSKEEASPVESLPGHQMIVINKQLTFFVLSYTCQWEKAKSV